MTEKNYLTTAYDKTAVYEAEILPLLSRVYDIAGEHEIPFIACLCVRNNENSHTLATAANTSGPERTPAEMMVAASLFEQGGAVEKAMVCRAGSSFIMKAAQTGVIGDDADEEDVADAEEAEASQH